MNTTQTQHPDTLGQEDELSSHQCKVYLETGGWYRVRGRSDTAMVLQISSMYAEIARLTAENDALKAKMELVDYVLQDDIHNRLTPRVVDIAYSAFTFGRRDTPHDWFNDTKPMVMEQLSKIQKHLAEEAASRSDMADAYCGAREDLAIWKRRALEAEEKLRAESAVSSRLVSELNAENGPTHMGEPVPQRNPLSVARIKELSVGTAFESVAFARAIEAAHGIGEKI